MAHNIPVWQSKHDWDDGLGPIPPWTPDARSPLKPGQSKGAFIWPRDKRMSSTPLTSWRRWKDCLSSKGPPVYVGHRGRFGPTKATWSGWTQPEFDSLGYRDEDCLDLNAGGEGNGGKVYDFRTRRWTKDGCRPDVWSDVKWGKAKRRGGQKIPLYHRDGYGVEFSKRNGRLWPFDTTVHGNDFRYRPHVAGWDWTHPWAPGVDYRYLDT